MAIDQLNSATGKESSCLVFWQNEGKQQEIF
jgi:hypothetical protein